MCVVCDSGNKPEQRIVRPILTTGKREILQISYRSFSKFDLVLAVLSAVTINGGTLGMNGVEE